MPQAAAFSPKKVEGKSKPWCIDVPAKHSETGKRQRLFFTSKEDAQRAAALQRMRISTHGAEQVLIGPKTRKAALSAHKLLEPLGISIKEAADIVVNASAILPPGISIKAATTTVATAVEVLGERGTIADAVEHFVKWQRERESSVTLAALLEEFQSRKESQGRSHAYLKQIRQTANRFNPMLGDTLLPDITGAVFQGTFDDAKLHPTHHNSFKRVLRAAFNYALKRDYIRENPILKVESAEEIGREVAVLNNAQARALMESADSEILPFFAISLFAGLRPTEVYRLRWEDLDFVRKRLFVRPRPNQKERSGRFVPMEPNLHEWLTPYRTHSGDVVPFTPQLIRQHHETTRARADELLINSGRERDAHLGKSKGWDQDCVRHTCASNWGAIHEDIAKVSLWLGHTQQVHKRHYHTPIDREEAEVYFAIAPAETANVVPMV